jgi:hypothetical protein
MSPAQFWATVIVATVAFWTALALIAAPRLYHALTVVIGTY